MKASRVDYSQETLSHTHRTYRTCTGLNQTKSQPQEGKWTQCATLTRKLFDIDASWGRDIRLLQQSVIVHINHTPRQSQEKVVNTKQTPFSVYQGSGQWGGLFYLIFFLSCWLFCFCFFLREYKRKNIKLSDKGGREDREELEERNNMIKVYYMRFKNSSFSFLLSPSLNIFISETRNPRRERSYSPSNIQQLSRTSQTVQQQVHVAMPGSAHTLTGCQAWPPKLSLWESHGRSKEPTCQAVL